MDYRTPKRLESWKAIADYLGRDVRTVARWEREGGLPVHREFTGLTQSAYANVEEIDRWRTGVGRALMEEGAVQPAEGKSEGAGYEGATVLRGAAIVLGVLAIPFVVWTVWDVGFAPKAIESVAPQGRAIVATTAGGDTAWRFSLPAPLTLPSGDRYSDIGDFDGARGPEVVAAPIGTFESSDRLYLLSNRGEVRWEKTLDGSLTYGTTAYGPPWRTMAVRRFEIDGAPRIAWATHHQVWWPSILAILDASGQVLDRFAHLGWITAVRATRDGRHLLAAAVANPYQAYALAVLDARQPSGAPPHPPGDAHACKDCPAGSPERYFVLGRSELAALAEAPLLHELAPPSITMLSTGGFEVRVMQSPGQTGVAEAVFEFGEDLVLRRAQVTETYWSWHSDLERTGRVTHAARDCPDQQGLPVRMWTAAGGWSDVRTR